MSAENALRAALVAYAPLTALVSTRISADRAEQGTARPLVVFGRTASEPLQSMDGSVLATMVALDVECWADTRLSAEAVADTATAAIRATLPNSVVNRSSVIDGELDLEGSILSVNWWE